MAYWGGGRVRPTRDEGSGDDYVNVQTLLGKQLHLRLDERRRHLLSVAPLALAGLLHVHCEGLGSQRLELLQGSLSGRQRHKRLFSLKQVVCV